MFLFGKGIKKDYEKAYHHFNISKNLNNSEGMYYVGYMIENKLTSINEDFIYLYEQAAN